jgi:hypothetical protein
VLTWRATWSKSGTASEPMVLEEEPDRLGHLLEAVLADDQAVVRVRTKRLVVGAQPLGQPLAVGLGTKRSRPPPITRRGTSGSASPVDLTPSSICRRAAPDSTPIMCWTRITSARLRSGFWRWIASGAPSQPMQLAAVLARQQADECGAAVAAGQPAGPG